MIGKYITFKYLNEELIGYVADKYLGISSLHSESVVTFYLVYREDKFYHVLPKDIISIDDF